MAWQSRHLSYLAEFTSDIRHISRVENMVADTLSCPPAGEINAVAATPVQVDYQAIAEARRACPETAAASITSTTLQQIQLGGTQLLCDTNGPHPRPLIPTAYRRHLKEGLKARGAQADWPQHLPWILLNIRTAPKTDCNTSTAEMVYRAALTLPAQPPSPNETTPARLD